MNFYIACVCMMLVCFLGITGCAVSQPVDGLESYSEDRVLTDDQTAESEDEGDESEDEGDESEDEGDESGDEGDESGDEGDESEDEGDESEDGGDESEDEGDESEDGGDESRDEGDESEDEGDESEDEGDESEDEYESCDGKNIACYADGCWECAVQNQCKKVNDRCREDSADSTGCASYSGCIAKNCCNASGCVTGNEWIECSSDCQKSLNTASAAIAQFQEISKCVVCEACPVSCASKRPDEFHICVKEKEINSPDAVCYEEDVAPDEVACYSWAGWGGPCTPWVQKCYTDPECWGLQECYDDTWNHDDWQDRQEKCFSAVSKDVESMFWDQRQCIYCQACDISCLKDAGAANCVDYLNLY